jgi:hypothetical protein
MRSVLKAGISSMQLSYRRSASKENAPLSLDRTCGKGRWRKMKGTGMVRIADGTICQAEIHWFEAHSIGRKDFKIKRVIR